MGMKNIKDWMNEAWFNFFNKPFRMTDEDVTELLQQYSQEEFLNSYYLQWQYFKKHS